jgi:hypothetical protein
MTQLDLEKLSRYEPYAVKSPFRPYSFASKSLIPRAAVFLLPSPLYQIQPEELPQSLAEAGPNLRS